MRKKAKPPAPEAALAAQRVRWLKHKGTKYLLVDFSGLSPEASLSLVDQFDLVMRETKGSLRMLTDVSNASYDASILNKWRQVRFQYNDRIERSAVFGASGLVLMAVKSFYQTLDMMGISEIAQRLRIFGGEAEAKEWLIQATPSKGKP